MHRIWNSLNLGCALLAACMLSACAPSPLSPQSTILAPTSPAYDYPIQNPYAATVIAMPPDKKVDLSDIPKPDEETITIFPDRKIPDGYWYEKGLHYGQLIQPNPAPLIYVIAGTGGDHRSEKMHSLARMFYCAGFSVVLLPSPTHQNFIVNASTSFGGRPIESARDLYRVMGMIDQRIAATTTITERMLTGYSLGAMDAAFTAKLDDQEHQLNFSRVLLINPPYSLVTSIKRIDQMLYMGMPGGMDDANKFIDKIVTRLGSMDGGGEALDFTNGNLLMEAYQQGKLTPNNFATTIGLSFRLSASSMVFANDVMSHSGYIFPKDKDFTTETNLLPVMAIALRTSFVDYANAYYAGKLKQANGETSKTLATEDSLAYLDSYLRNNPKFGLITNQDDVILGPGEVEKLASLFGTNEIVFSNGGHLGNMTHPAVAYAIVHFMKNGAMQ